MTPWCVSPGAMALCCTPLWTPRATSARYIPGIWPGPPRRYTEARLDPICGELFRDIDKDTVDFVDNYDGTMKEPTLLPTTFPNVLVIANHGHCRRHGQSNICGFNLGEVCDTAIACIRNPEARPDDHPASAPDFPTGGAAAL